MLFSFAPPIQTPDSALILQPYLHIWNCWNLSDPLDASGENAYATLSVSLYLPLVSGVAGAEGTVEAAAINATTIIKYYYLNGLRVAVRKGSTLTYLHSDHLGSTALATKTDGTMLNLQAYTAYGSNRGGGTIPTDNRFTGQKLDTSGLMYYNARYYDPTIGQFISPDTLVPDAANVMDYNRYMYVRGNPLNMVDPTGHCPTAPSSMGAAICVSLFIQPETVSAGPLVVHGDGRSFSNNSDPSASRGYAWLPLDGSPAQTYMNPSGYVVPTLGTDQVPMSPVPLPNGTTIVSFPASDKNTWDITQSGNGTIIVNYDLVLSGPLGWSGAGPHINGTMVFHPNADGGYNYSFSRDGFPWAEAYLHDGNGGVQTIFQDSAVTGNPHDLFGMEPNIGVVQQAIKFGQNLLYGQPQTSNVNSYSCNAGQPC